MDATEQRRANIKRCWWIIERDFERRRQRKKGKRPSIATLRVCELDRLFYVRYHGSMLPEDDDGWDSAVIMVNHLAMLADPDFRIRDWLRRRAPWFRGDKAERRIEMAIARPTRWRADTLAKRLNLTDAERSRLEIRTIGAADVTRGERVHRRRERDRLAKQDKRRAAGAKPQATSVSRTKPWEEAGISRRTWYRRRAQLAQVAQPHPQYVTCTAGDEVVPPSRLAVEPNAARLPSGPPPVRQTPPLLANLLASRSVLADGLPSRAATPFDWRQNSARSWAEIEQFKRDVQRTWQQRRRTGR
jgi:hypothetical protein